MAIRSKEMKWFDSKEEVELFQLAGNDRLQQRELDHAPLHYVADHNRLLAISRNEELVLHVKQYMRACYADYAENQHSPGAILLAKAFVIPARQMIVAEQQGQDWIYVVFDHSHSLHIIGGEIGSSQILEWSTNEMNQCSGL
ncbi:hypothetical protein PaecuDRAFT_3047 [Paenibacillus curdlanolyticus YK9]|uniref:Uncharacterized protein n=1 Tax=Paenibacillus curdlanolyticus YK9 TaxID=717606 RepID=E0IBK8_9BACL|nr:hypothetical protein [Paenibacillus curdlanolyticus]EFM10088.1 hypothetical protein PaecuDRAFT_3047 [Paenibacillus curdlanolyticus YK9]